MTPATYSPWLKVFEALGQAGIKRRRVRLGKLTIGDPTQTTDATGGSAWTRHATAESLFRLWGPPAKSPWAPYHRPTLFAALDALKGPAHPRVPAGPDAAAAPRTRPPWTGPDRAVILDLPGEESVLWGAHLARVAGYEPVVTFNNWPHPDGVVDMRGVLAALLFLAPWVEEANKSWTAPRPPVFLLDAHRFGYVKPRPNDFDNRYYLLEADLPSARRLHNAGIRHVVYVRPPTGAPLSQEPPKSHLERRLAERQALETFGRALPSPKLQKILAARSQEAKLATRAVADDEDDVNPYLHELRKTLGLELARVARDAWDTPAAAPFAPAVRKSPLNTTKDPAFRGFRRNAAGGFGSLISESSGGG